MPVHDLMLTYQLIGLDLGLGDDSVRLALGICQDGLLIAYNLLIALDLIRRLGPQFLQKAFQLVPVDDNLGAGKRGGLALSI